MNCPVCTVALVMTDRLGVEIDYCPRCRGVWLDRGELDKIVERSAADPRSETAVSHQAWDDLRQPDGEGRRHGVPPQRRRKSFFGELFDFD